MIAKRDVGGEVPTHCHCHCCCHCYCCNLPQPIFNQISHVGRFTVSGGVSPPSVAFNFCTRHVYSQPPPPTLHWWLALAVSRKVAISQWLLLLLLLASFPHIITIQNRRELCCTASLGYNIAGLIYQYIEPPLPLPKGLCTHTCTRQLLCLSVNKSLSWAAELLIQMLPLLCVPLPSFDLPCYCYYYYYHKYCPESMLLRDFY